jgi:hypothetical protein
MELNIDYIISILEKYTGKKNKELGEQDSAPSGGDAGGGGSYPNVPKWKDLYQIKRGKGNKLGVKGEKWSTEMTRGVGNQIW